MQWSNQSTDRVTQNLEVCVSPTLVEIKEMGLGEAKHMASDTVFPLPLSYPPLRVCQDHLLFQPGFPSVLLPCYLKKSQVSDACLTKAIASQIALCFSWLPQVEQHGNKFVRTSCLRT